MVRQRAVKRLSNKVRIPKLNDLVFRPKTIKAQRGLVPIPNTPFYMTPEAPSDPMDCRKYPDSIFCSNPVSSSPFKITTDIVLDECNIGYQFNGKIAFITMPATQIVYRKPNCRVPEEVLEEPSFPDDPIITEEACDGNNPVYFWATEYFLWYRVYFVPEAINYQYRLEYIEGTVSVNSIERFYKEYEDGGFDTGWNINYSVNYKTKHVHRISQYSNVMQLEKEHVNEDRTFKYYNQDDSVQLVTKFFDAFPNIYWGHISGSMYSMNKTMSRRKSYDEPSFGAELQENTYYWHMPEGIEETPDIANIEFPYGIIEVNKGEPFTDFFGFRFTPYHYKLTNYSDRRTEHRKLYIACGDKTIFTKTIQPPPPPPPYMSQCCPDYSTLLKGIYQECKKANKRIGSDEFPATVPESFLKTDGKESGTKNIENLGELIAWLAERMDELVGEFEIPIKIEDANLTQEGNQELTIKLPNIAEAIAEMFSLLLNNAVNQEVVLALAAKSLVEAGNTKQVATKNNYILEAIVDYLAFKTKEITTKLPLAFTPGAEDFSLLLQEKEIDMTALEYDDKTNLQATLTELLFAGSVIRGAFYRRLETPTFAKQEIANNIFRALQVKSNLGDAAQTGTQEIQDFINKIINKNNADSGK